MPKVTVWVNPRLYKTNPLQQFVNTIPKIVAKALSTGPRTAGELSSEEIDVTVHPYGPMDIYHHDIGIIINANDYPARSKDLDDRSLEMVNKAAETLANGSLFAQDARLLLGPKVTIKGFVWPLLAKGAFKEFTVSLEEKALQR